MTPRLPNLTARDVVRALTRAGFEFQRQKGSHATWRNPQTKRTTVVPMHGGDLRPSWARNARLFVAMDRVDCSLDRRVAAV